MPDLDQIKQVEQGVWDRRGRLRIRFDEHGIFRHYPELDSAA